jgi:mono/diheme cytochrome c family protein
MKQRIPTYLILTLGLVVAALAISSKNVPVTPETMSVPTKQSRVARGEYLVTIGGCNDCHTPFKVGPNGPEPDMTRALSGHPENVVMPPPPKSDGPWLWSGAATNTAFAGPWGISYARNLTPEQLTGTGIWTEEMFIKTIRSGRHWGVGRPILPPMPWFNYAKASDEDLKSIYAYLRTVKPIKNEVPEAVVAPPPPAPAKG